jgi:predicted acylesterase/phospholipase RssA
MKKAIFVIIPLILVSLAVAGWLYFIKGYVGVRKRDAVPAALIHKAQLPGMKNVRLMADVLKIRHASLRKIMDDAGLAKAEFHHPDINILAISGGGANGAYGAGILCGWSETGKRPEFDIVTGVSTGALIAPAAFLGPSYDNVIRDIYTNISDADIMRQGFLQFLFVGRPSLLDTQPLRHVLNEAVTEKVLEDVAREHAKGRRLYIATTNLDARRLVIWDMGAIAKAGTPQALELFRSVMLASASIPVAFPPVMITVSSDGRLYDEMHVDGSVVTQIIGSVIMAGYDEMKSKRTNVYVIRNGKLADVPEEVPYKVWDIASAAFATLVTWQSYADMYRFSVLARYERIRFYFTCIPYEFNEPRRGEFDLAYMRKLFYRGYNTARSGGHWTRQIGRTFTEVAPDK